MGEGIYQQGSYQANLPGPDIGQRLDIARQFVAGDRLLSSAQQILAVLPVNKAPTVQRIFVVLPVLKRLVGVLYQISAYLNRF